MMDFSPYLIAAFRETFEEGGIFLSSSAILKERLDSWRRMVRFYTRFWFLYPVTFLI